MACAVFISSAFGLPPHCLAAGDCLLLVQSREPCCCCKEAITYINKQGERKSTRARQKVIVVMCSARSLSHLSASACLCLYHHHLERSKALIASHRIASHPTPPHPNWQIAAAVGSRMIEEPAPNLAWNFAGFKFIPLFFLLVCNLEISTQHRHRHTGKLGCVKFHPGGGQR